MEDIEEYVTKAYAAVNIPTKASSIAQDSANVQQVEKAKIKAIIRKEMKRSKAHIVRVTEDFPKRLVMEADTPYKAYLALKTKYSVAKNRQDFTKLDHQWNQFKITDTKADPDKIFATLE